MSAVMQYLAVADRDEDDPTVEGDIRVTNDGRISVIDAIACVSFVNPDGTFKPNARRMASLAFSRIAK
eukprot:3993407-Prorocentrum_lima.AAC.1